MRSADCRPAQVPVHGVLGGSVANRQHLYFVNVSEHGHDPLRLAPAAPQRLSVRLTQDHEAARGGEGVGSLVLSLCHNNLPCGGLDGCACPRRYVDDGSRGLLSSSNLGASAGARSVAVSPCALDAGIWYVAVDLAPDKLGRATAAREAVAGYTLTAVLESAAIAVGEAEADEVCCMQSQYFVADIGRLIKGNELRVKLVSNNGMPNHTPLRLSVTYDGCVDHRINTVSDPSKGQVVTLAPEDVRVGRLFVGVHAVGRDSARFLLSVSYRPELKWTVIAFLVSMLVVVVVTLTLVCCLRVRRKLRKMKNFSDQVNERKKALKMTLRGGSGTGSDGEGRSGVSARVRWHACIRGGAGGIARVE